MQQFLNRYGLRGRVACVAQKITDLFNHKTFKALPNYRIADQLLVVLYIKQRMQQSGGAHEVFGRLGKTFADIAMPRLQRPTANSRLSFALALRN